MKQLLAELFEKYYIDVYTYLYSLCHDASLSEDLASDVFLEVVKSISTFRGQSDIKTWLFSIARHRWFAYLKKKNLAQGTLYYRRQKTGQLLAIRWEPCMQQIVDRDTLLDSDMLLPFITTCACLHRPKKNI